MTSAGSGPSDGADAAPLNAGTLQRQAIRGSFWTLASTAGSLPLSLLSVVVAGRVLGPSGFGQYSLYTFCVALGLLVVDLGLLSSQTWAATTGRASDHALLVRTLRGSATWNWLKLPVVAAGCVVMLQAHPATVVLVLGLAAHLAAQSLTLAVMADRRYGALSVVALVNATTSAVGTCAGAWLTGSAEWTIAGFWIGRLVALPLLYRSTPAELRRPALTPGSLRMDRVSLSFGGSNFLASLMTTWVTGRSELVFLERTGDGAAQGRFALATTVASRATLLADALYGALGIAMVALRSADGPRFVEAFQRSLRMTTLLSVGTAAGVTSAAALLAPPLFGAEYGPVVLSTALLLQVALLRTAWQPLITWVFTERINKALLLPGVVAVVVDVVLSIVLIPRSPFAGAVTANAVSGLLFLLATAATATLPAGARRELVRCSTRFVTVAVLASLALLVPWPDDAGWLSLLVHAVVSTAVTVAVAGGLPRFLGPLMSQDEKDSIERSIPRRVRILFRLLCFVFDAGRWAAPSTSPDRDAAGAPATSA